ncbi:MAG: hypothetical protein NTW21_00540 [Verrucomicrobia bacterium]|nr:hypothetical protein [Verrucomicrobiota bacterium]
MKADRRGRLRFSPGHRIALLKAYHASGLSGQRIAAQHGVKYPTLAFAYGDRNGGRRGREIGKRIYDIGRGFMISDS